MLCSVTRGLAPKAYPKMQNQGEVTLLFREIRVLQNGRVEYFGCVRHKSVEECAVGALAMQLFQTFHILEPRGLPDFNSRQSW